MGQEGVARSTPSTLCVCRRASFKVSLSRDWTAALRIDLIDRRLSVISHGIMLWVTIPLRTVPHDIMSFTCVCTRLSDWLAVPRASSPPSCRRQSPYSSPYPVSPFPIPSLPYSRPWSLAGAGGSRKALKLPGEYGQSSADKHMLMHYSSKFSRLVMLRLLMILLTFY